MDLKGSYVVWVRCVLLSVLVKLKGDSSFTSNIITSSGIMAAAKLGIPKFGINVSNEKLLIGEKCKV